MPTRDHRPLSAEQLRERNERQRARHDRLVREQYTPIDFPILVNRAEPPTAEASPATAVAPATVPAEIAELNADHFVTLEGGRCLVMKEEYSPELGRTVLKALNRSDFAAFHANRTVRWVDENGDEQKVPLGRYWLQHEQRRTYTAMALLPNGACPPDVFNLWRGLAIDPAPGPWPRLAAHIKTVICSGNETLSTYLLDWLAFCVQSPERRSEIAVVLRGSEGTGKGLLGHLMRRLLGQHAMYIAQSSQLVGKFNAHLRDVCFLFADESVWAGDKEGQSVLKSLVTEPVLMIERKGVDAVLVPNRLSILMCTNAGWAIPASRDARRFFVLDVSNRERGKSEYFRALHHELETDGAAAFLHALLNRDLGNFDHRTAPGTRALTSQIIRSFSLEERWWFERLVEGRPIAGPAIWTPPEAVTGWDHWDRVDQNVAGPGIEVAKSDLHGDYLEFATRHRAPTRAPRSTQTLLGRFLKEVLPPGQLRTAQRAAIAMANAPPGDAYQLPDLTACRAAFSMDRPGLFEEPAEVGQVGQAG